MYEVGQEVMFKNVAKHMKYPEVYPCVGQVGVIVCLYTNFAIVNWGTLGTWAADYEDLEIVIRKENNEVDNLPTIIDIVESLVIAILFSFISMGIIAALVGFFI